MIYHIFISHCWDYSEPYDKLVYWINSDSHLKNSWYNYSVPLSNPIIVTQKRELKKKLTNKISLSNVIIILSGMYAAYSEWIDYEIDEAVRMGKYIIGVKPWGQERIPRKIQDNATIIVGWNSSSIIEAIKSYKYI